MSLPPLPARSRTQLIQLGLFGDCTEAAEMHVVSAHTRLLHDGTEVFVAEHTRWNRGRTHRVPKPRTRKKDPIGSDQPSLFCWQKEQLDRTLPSEATDGHWGDEVEVFPGAVQLPLWRRPDED